MLEQYQQTVSNIIRNNKRHYNQVINIALSQQRSNGVFKYAVIGVLQQIYDDLLGLLRSLDPNQITPETKSLVVSAYDDVVNEIVEHALNTHRTSCALSNFADEHKPSQEYIADVLLQAQHDWHKFTEQASGLLSEK